MEEIDWKVKFVRVSADVDRLSADKIRLEKESEGRKKLAESLAEDIHALKGHTGSFCFCTKDPCDGTFRKLYDTRK